MKNQQDRAAESRAETAMPTNGIDSTRPPDLHQPLDDEMGPPTQGIFEPPNSFIADAIGYHKLLIGVFAVAFALIGAGLGLARQPVYTASATLQVGEVNPNSPGFGGYTQSASSLATAFSRSIVAAPVLATIQRKLNLEPTTSASRLSAEPIPLSPAFRVIATGPTQSSAIKLANLTSSAVVAYVAKSNSSNPEARALLRAYRRAAFDVKRAKSTQDALKSEGSASSEALLQAEAAKSTAEVKLEAISRSYIAAVTSQAPRTGLVSVLAGATSVSSDRNSKLELFAFIGLLIGLVLGCAAAVWRERHPPQPADSPPSGLVPRPR